MNIHDQMRRWRHIATEALLVLDDILYLKGEPRALSLSGVNLVRVQRDFLDWCRQSVELEMDDRDEDADPKQE